VLHLRQWLHICAKGNCHVVLRLFYLLFPYACDEGNTQGENGTDMDEARCWNGTELQHLATAILLRMPETPHHTVTLFCYDRDENLAEGGKGSEN
jgi:hypothetical protein